MKNQASHFIANTFSIALNFQNQKSFSQETGNKNLNTNIMRTINSVLFNSFSLLVVLALVFTTSCSTDESELIPQTQEESAHAFDKMKYFSTLQDTLDFLQEQARTINLHTDYLNEIPGPDANITGEELVKIADPVTGEEKEFVAQVIDGNLMVEGDIMIASEEEYRRQQSRANRRGVVSTIWTERWPNGFIPYEIQEGHPELVDIITGIMIVNAQTNLTLIPRTNEADYAYFPITTLLNASVGKQGGRQNINIKEGASMGNVMHEILHTAGMWHEHTRCDRDNHVYYLEGNVKLDKRHNFEKECTDAVDIFDYDYGSIMHYGPSAFTISGASYSLLPKVEMWIPFKFWIELGKMGQRDGLSEIDIKTVNAMYPR